jgi:hypothetical protein
VRSRTQTVTSHSLDMGVWALPKQVADREGRCDFSVIYLRRSV